MVDTLMFSPHTLIHNDLNNRNLCFETRPDADSRRLCVYDWEMVSLGCPQHDVVDFLAFTLPEHTTVTTWLKYRDIYRDHFTAKCKNFESDCESGMTTKSTIKESLQKSQFDLVFDMCVLELLYLKLMMCCTTYRCVKLPYLQRVMQNVGRYARYIVQQQLLQTFELERHDFVRD